MRYKPEMEMSKQDIELMYQLGIGRFTEISVNETDELMKRAVEIGAKPYVVPGENPECGYSRIPLYSKTGARLLRDWVSVISADGTRRLNFEVMPLPEFGEELVS